MKRVRAVLGVLGVLAVLIPEVLPEAQAQTPAKSMFVFQNRFWLNLHQFMRGEVYRRRSKLMLGIEPASLAERDRVRWISALDAYAEFAKHDILFDEWSVRVHNTLAGIDDDAPLRAGMLDEGVVSALNAAAPSYRARLWAVRRSANEAWIASAKSLLDRHEAAMFAALADVYRVTWPREPFLVDAVGETGPNSGFTHGGPAGYAAHIQVSTGSLRNVGDAPLELIFHEASHIAPVGGRITQMIAEEAARQQVAAPEDLWHYMFMYTTGELTKRELATAGRPSYARYDERYGQIPAKERAAFERDWQPYLEGRSSFEAALHDLVRDAR